MGAGDDGAVFVCLVAEGLAPPHVNCLVYREMWGLGGVDERHPSTLVFLFQDLIT